MKLHQLPTLKGAFHRKKRKGCGRSSGHGKTSCRGHKGGKARSGYSVRPGFEGGQTPLWMRIPKRGFTRGFDTSQLAIVNLGDLVKISKDIITKEDLVLSGLIRSALLPVKLLGDGTLMRKLTITVNSVSVSARLKIEALGGSVLIEDF
jgi:large subunit ribosomal protein L15